MANSLNPDYWQGLVGKRIRLTHMGDDPNPLAIGSMGQVERVSRWPDGSHQLGVKWEGQTRTLGLVCPPDRFVVVETANS
jgi:hypothetical protein